MAVFATSCDAIKDVFNNNATLPTTAKEKIAYAFNGVASSMTDQKAHLKKRDSVLVYADSYDESEQLKRIYELFDVAERKSDPEFDYDEPPMIQFQYLKSLYEETNSNYELGKVYKYSFDGTIKYDFATGERTIDQNYVCEARIDLDIDDNDIITAHFGVILTYTNGDDVHEQRFYAEMTLVYDMTKTLPNYELSMKYVDDCSRYEADEEKINTYEYDYVNTVDGGISEWRKFYYCSPVKMVKDDSHATFDAYRGAIDYSGRARAYKDGVAYFTNHTDSHDALENKTLRDAICAEFYNGFGLNATDIKSDVYHAKDGVENAAIKKTFDKFSEITKEDIISSLVTSGADKEEKHHDEEEEGAWPAGKINDYVTVYVPSLSTSQGKVTRVENDERGILVYLEDVTHNEYEEFKGSLSENGFVPMESANGNIYFLDNGDTLIVISVYESAGEVMIAKVEKEQGNTVEVSLYTVEKGNVTLLAVEIGIEGKALDISRYGADYEFYRDSAFTIPAGDIIASQGLALYLKPRGYNGGDIGGEGSNENENGGDNGNGGQGDINYVHVEYYLVTEGSAKLLYDEYCVEGKAIDILQIGNFVAYLDIKLEQEADVIYAEEGLCVYLKPIGSNGENGQNNDEGESGKEEENGNGGQSEVNYVSVEYYLVTEGNISLLERESIPEKAEIDVRRFGDYEAYFDKACTQRADKAIAMANLRIYLKERNSQPSTVRFNIKALYENGEFIDYMSVPVNKGETIGYGDYEYLLYEDAAFTKLLDPSLTVALESDATAYTRDMYREEKLYLTTTWFINGVNVTYDATIAGNDFFVVRRGKLFKDENAFGPYPFRNGNCKFYYDQNKSAPVFEDGKAVYFTEGENVHIYAYLESDIYRKVEYYCGDTLLATCMVGVGETIGEGSLWEKGIKITELGEVRCGEIVTVDSQDVYVDRVLTDGVVTVVKYERLAEIKYAYCSKGKVVGYSYSHIQKGEEFECDESSNYFTSPECNEPLVYKGTLTTGMTVYITAG